jgi:hypothetical protein
MFDRSTDILIWFMPSTFQRLLNDAMTRAHHAFTCTALFGMSETRLFRPRFLCVFGVHWSAERMPDRSQRGIGFSTPAATVHAAA